MARIFISYKRANKDKVFPLVEHIEKQLDCKCWVDLDGIESSVQFASVICHAIDDSEVVLFMHSSVHLNIDFETDWTIKELNYAQMKKKRIQLVKLDEAPLNNIFLMEFGSKNNTDTQDPIQIQKLINDLREWLHLSEPHTDHSAQDSSTDKTATPSSNNIRQFYHPNGDVSNKGDGISVARLLKIASIIVLTLLSVVAILWGVFFTLSKDVCTKYATEITQDAGYVHMIADENERVKRDWEEFNKTYEYKHSPERIAAMQESMLNRIESTEQILTQLWTVESTPMTVTPYHSFLLSLHGINSEEIALSPAFATLYYNDYMEQLSRIRATIMDPSALNRRFVNTLFEVFDHTLNSYYVSLLSELSLFPKNSRKTFNKMRPQWSYFPQSYNIDQDREYYEDIIETENRLANELLSQYRSVLMEQDSELEDIIRENEELKQKVNKALKNSEVERTQKEHDAEIAMRQEKIKAKESIVKASEAELEELDKQYIEVYNTLKEKCHINADDEQSYKWGKIRRWGNYINMLVESRQSLEEQGIHSSSTITPNMAYENMRTMLSSYQSNHPESADYITATNLFFKELSLGSREYAGVLIFAFKDNAEHPFFNIGDIVVEYNGKTIKDYNEFKAAYNENPSAKVGLLRVINGRFERVTHPMEASDIVGFINLTE